LRWAEKGKGKEGNKQYKKKAKLATPVANK
jgi:hypothetical protein